MGKKKGKGLVFTVFSEKDTVFSICIKTMLLGYGVLFLSGYIEKNFIRLLVSPENFKIAKWCNYIFHGVVTLPCVYWLLGFKTAAKKLRNSGWR